MNRLLELWEKRSHYLLGSVVHPHPHLLLLLHLYYLGLVAHHRRLHQFLPALVVHNRHHPHLY